MNDNLELILQETKGRLKEQLASIEQLGSKFNFLLAFNSIIIASIFQGTVATSQSESLGFLLGTAILLLLISAFFDLRGLILQKYRRDPNPSALYKKYKEKQIRETKKVLILNYIDSFEYNKKKMHRVNKYFAFSIAFSSTALLFIFLFLNKYNITIPCQKITENICQN